MGLNSESRTVNAGKNAVSAIGNKIIILILTFISRKFFIQYIGVEYLGINGLFSNILTLLSMADLGLGTAMNVSLYKPIAENDYRKLSALLNYFRKLYIIIATGVMVIGLALMPFLKYIVNMDQDIPYLYVYYAVFVLKSAVSYLFIYKSSIVRADQKAFQINKVEVYTNVVKVVLQLVVVMTLHSYLVYILLDVVAIVVQNFTVSHIADKNYPFIKFKEELSSEEKKDIFSDISSVFLYKIAWSLLNGTDNILMSMMIGTIYVGYYSNYYTITSNLELFIALLFTSLTASVGNLVATSTAENKYKTFKTMQMIGFWISGVVSVCLLFLMQDFIVLWLGEEMLLDNITLVAIIINIFFSICMRPVWTFREGTGMYRQIRYIMFVTAILNLVLSIILGKIIGLSGIIFATAIAKLTTYFWYEPNILFKNFFNKKVGSYYLDYVVNTILIFICIGLCYIPLHLITEISIFTWLLKAFICLVIINLVYFLRYSKTEELKNVKQKATQLLRARKLNKSEK